MTFVLSSFPVCPSIYPGLSSITSVSIQEFLCGLQGHHLPTVEKYFVYVCLNISLMTLTFRRPRQTRFWFWQFPARALWEQNTRRHFVLRIPILAGCMMMTNVHQCLLFPTFYMVCNLMISCPIIPLPPLGAMSMAALKTYHWGLHSLTPRGTGPLNDRDVLMFYCWNEKKKKK